MEKEQLLCLLRRGVSQRDIASELGCSQSSVRYWMSKYGLSSSDRAKRCRYCGTHDSSCFLDNSYQVCISCRNKKYTVRWDRMRADAIMYLGGCCRRCGYSTYAGALEFHHRDSAQKGSDWDRMKKWSKKRIREELDKCVLLCSNCHREVHAGL